MYLDRPIRGCDMPACDKPLRALVISGTLKKNPAISNTETLAAVVLRHLKTHGVQQVETVRLADLDIKTGLEEDMGGGDQWPEVADKIRAADIVLFATPIWWGQIASPMKRAIERMDLLEHLAKIKATQAAEHMAEQAARNLADCAKLLMSHSMVLQVTS